MSEEVQNKLLPVKNSGRSLFNKKDIFEKKEELLRKHYGNNDNIINKIINNPDGRTLDMVLSTVIEEMFKDSDDLLGNKLLFTEENNLSEANDVTTKRSSILAKIADISLKKQEIISRTQDVDLNSPAFFLFQELCFEKMKDTLIELKMEDEKIQLVIMKWAEKMKNWDKILTEKLDAYKSEGK